MKVYKFGGASIETPERMTETAKIIAATEEQPLLVVISALGKTTNALEKVVDSFFYERKDEALKLFEKIKEQHLNFIKYTIVKNWKEAENKLKDFFTEIEWLLHDKPVREYDYYYDQIVCCGELMSTSIVHYILLELTIDAAWIDVRDLIRTDDNFRDAIIDWKVTGENVESQLKPLIALHKVVITQGFVGATDENESTTLGREGSDFTAAIFASLLDAEDVTIWKDVPGVMSGDPKSYAAAEVLPALSYSEVVEMAYYGAQVIHPKTIKPLQNKKIPLNVRSFLDPTLAGTTISSAITKDLPALVINKANQVMLTFRSKDFSFVEDKPINALYEMFHSLKIKPTVSQNAAISLICCFTDREEKINSLAASAAEYFDVALERNLSLVTIRHYNEEVIENLTGDKEIVLLQKTHEVLQAVIRNPVS